MNISKSNSFVLRVAPTSIQNPHSFRMSGPFFRIAMVSITFYDSTINLLDNP